jgi:cytoskeletal protein CcmA (bactofilin family)
VAAPTPAAAPAPSSAPAARPVRQVSESIIAADLTIEGKIHGTGHVRIAGQFKGDVNVEGDLTIEKGAKLSGGVRAK